MFAIMGELIEKGEGMVDSHTAEYD